MWKVQLFELNYDHREEEAVSQVLKSRWITMGEQTTNFESKFGEFLGAEHLPTAVSSATAALHMALLALEIGAGSEVIISGLTFVADANVVKMVGANPVLADVTSLSDWNVSAKTIEARITPKTRAILIVHFGGVPCEMDSIVRLAQKHNIPLIEDVAHAPGATYKNVMCGNFGDLAAFSFFTNKNLSVGEGGMVVAKTKEINEKIKYLRSHGMTTLTLDRHQGRAITYDVIQPGLNYRMDEIRASLGLVQLDKLLNANSRRKAIFEYYCDKLSAFNEISIPFHSIVNKTSSYHIFPILLSPEINRNELFLALKARGIQASIHYPAIRSFSAFKGEMEMYETPVSDDICNREITLPLYPTMTYQQVDLVVETLDIALKEQV